MQHVSQALLLKMALKFNFKFTERFYLSNLSRNGVVSSGAAYFEAPLILSTFAKGGRSKITFVVYMHALIWLRSYD